MFGSKIFCTDADQQCRIGVFFITGISAHAVGDDPSRFGSRRHHPTAGAHAKSICRAAVWQMNRQFIIRRAQTSHFFFAVLGFVNQALPVFYSGADGKRLLFNFNPLLIQYFKSVARTVANGQNRFFTGDFILRAIGFFYLQGF